MSTRSASTAKHQNNELYVKLFRAYLIPLLEKHNRGESIVYEDLMNSLNQADHILLQTKISNTEKQLKSSINKNESHDTIKKLLEDLHKEQIASYEMAAKSYFAKSISKYVYPSLKTPSEQLSNYIDRCRKEFIIKENNQKWNISLETEETFLWNPFKEGAQKNYQEMLKKRKDELKKVTTTIDLTASTKPTDDNAHQSEGTSRINKTETIVSTADSSKKQQQILNVNASEWNPTTGETSTATKRKESEVLIPHQRQEQTTSNNDENNEKDDDEELVEEDEEDNIEDESEALQNDDDDDIESEDEDEDLDEEDHEEGEDDGGDTVINSTAHADTESSSFAKSTTTTKKISTTASTKPTRIARNVNNTNRRTSQHQQQQQQQPPNKRKSRGGVGNRQQAKVARINPSSGSNDAAKGKGGSGRGGGGRGNRSRNRGGRGGRGRGNNNAGGK